MNYGLAEKLLLDKALRDKHGLVAISFMNDRTVCVSSTCLAQKDYGEFFVNLDYLIAIR